MCEHYTNCVSSIWYTLRNLTIVSPEEAIDIDTFFDFKLTEGLARRTAR